MCFSVSGERCEKGRNDWVELGKINRIQMTLDILKKDQSPYQKSFLKQYDHSDRYAIEDIEGWTNAHKQIHSRSDWSMGITQGFEAWLAKTVVNFMIKALDGVPEEVTKHPMGVEVKAGIWVLAVSARQRLQRLCTIDSIVVSMLFVLYLMSVPLL
ncbi:uncharacterized protein LOC131047222 [Cryptomeria japonica]|uniref:uncharacterized protein LOC131047222 n=1 Tax=Cryptomeria japonica TaxID=3369 RepID=UPI0027D9D5EC|nr:uncharacterized protein LOC131047222 [Cryptomeria japonica]